MSRADLATATEIRFNVAEILNKNEVEFLLHSESSPNVDEKGRRAGSLRMMNPGHDAPGVARAIDPTLPDPERLLYRCG